MKKKLSNRYLFDDLRVRSQDPYAHAKYEIILDWLKKGKHKTILDAGCGMGDFSFILSQQGYIAIGLDKEKDYIQLASEHTQKTNTKDCSFILSSIENYNCHKKYDAVIATDVLEHIKDDNLILEKLVSFLKPNGSIIITVPAGQYLFGSHDNNLRHLRRYSINSFQKIIPKNLRIKELRYFGFFLIPIALLISKILQKNYPLAKLEDKKNNFVTNNILNLILRIEKSSSFPLGTSLLFWGVKK